MKILFFGTPHFAAECLKYLLEHHVDIGAVVTQPDRPKGRSLQLSPSAVKAITPPSIPLFQPEKASTPEFLQQIAEIKADLFVVVAYGQILSQKLLDIPRLGCINVHASLLPKYRGAAPMQRAIMEGEKETGIAIQKMVRELDAGDVIAVSKTAIPDDMTLQELEEKLIELSKPLLLDVIHRYVKGIPEAKSQEQTQATYASKINLEEGKINWHWPSQKIHNLIRAFSPKPGAWSLMQNQKRVKILRSKQVTGNGLPGELIHPNGTIACGSGAIQLLEVQPEGKKAMAASDWLRGLPKDSKLFTSN